MSLYEVLGASRDAGDRTLRERYLASLRLHHPDRTRQRTNSNVLIIFVANFTAIQAAWDTLSDPAKKKKYDVTLDAAAAAAPRREVVASQGSVDSPNGGVRGVMSSIVYDPSAQLKVKPGAKLKQFDADGETPIFGEVVHETTHGQWEVDWHMRIEDGPWEADFPASELQGFLISDSAYTFERLQHEQRHTSGANRQYFRGTIFDDHRFEGEEEAVPGAPEERWTFFENKGPEMQDDDEKRWTLFGDGDADEETHDPTISHRRRWLRSIRAFLDAARNEARKHANFEYHERIDRYADLVETAFKEKVLHSSGYAVHADIGVHPLILLELLLLVTDSIGVGKNSSRRLKRIYAVFGNLGCSEGTHADFCDGCFFGECGGGDHATDPFTRFANLGCSINSLYKRYTRRALFHKWKHCYAKRCSGGFMFFVECFQLALLHWCLCLPQKSGDIDSWFKMTRRGTYFTRIPYNVMVFFDSQEIPFATHVRFSGHNEMCLLQATEKTENGVDMMALGLEVFSGLMVKIFKLLDFRNDLTKEEQALNEKSPGKSATKARRLGCSIGCGVEHENGCLVDDVPYRLKSQALKIAQLRQELAGSQQALAGLQPLATENARAYLQEVADLQRLVTENAQLRQGLEGLQPLATENAQLRQGLEGLQPLAAENAQLRQEVAGLQPLAAENAQLKQERGRAHRIAAENAQLRQELAGLQPLATENARAYLQEVADLQRLVTENVDLRNANLRFQQERDSQQERGTKRRKK